MGAAGRCCAPRLVCCKSVQPDEKLLNAGNVERRWGTRVHEGSYSGRPRPPRLWKASEVMVYSRRWHRRSPGPAALPPQGRRAARRRADCGGAPTSAGASAPRSGCHRRPQHPPHPAVGWWMGWVSGELEAQFSLCSRCCGEATSAGRDTPRHASAAAGGGTHLGGAQGLLDGQARLADLHHEAVAEARVSHQRVGRVVNLHSTAQHSTAQHSMRSVWARRAGQHKHTACTGNACSAFRKACSSAGLLSTLFPSPAPPCGARWTRWSPSRTGLQGAQKCSMHIDTGGCRRGAHQHSSSKCSRRMQQRPSGSAPSGGPGKQRRAPAPAYPSRSSPFESERKMRDSGTNMPSPLEGYSSTWLGSGGGGGAGSGWVSGSERGVWCVHGLASGGALAGEVLAPLCRVAQRCRAAAAATPPPPAPAAPKSTPPQEPKLTNPPQQGCPSPHPRVLDVVLARHKGEGRARHRAAHNRLAQAAHLAVGGRWWGFGRRRRTPQGQSGAQAGQGRCAACLLQTAPRAALLSCTASPPHAAPSPPLTSSQ